MSEYFYGFGQGPGEFDPLAHRAPPAEKNLEAINITPALQVVKSSVPALVGGSLQLNQPGAGGGMIVAGGAITPEGGTSPAGAGETGGATGGLVDPYAAVKAQFKNWCLGQAGGVLTGEDSCTVGSSVYELDPAAGIVDLVSGPGVGPPTPAAPGGAVMIAGAAAIAALMLLR